MFLAQKCFKKNIFFETNFMKNHRFLFVTKMFQKKYIFFSLCQNCITHIFRFLNRDTPGLVLYLKISFYENGGNVWLI